MVKVPNTRPISFADSRLITTSKPTMGSVFWLDVLVVGNIHDIVSI